MSVKIRLKRLGKIRVPQYRIVVVDSRKKRDGKVIEEIGTYQPKEEPSYIDVASERAQYWLGVGAQPSEAVAAILKVTGDWQKFRGEPGAEGTLKHAQPRRDKLEIFNEALKEASSEPRGDAVTGKGSGKGSAKDAGKGSTRKDQPAGTPAPEATPEAEKPEGAVDAAEAGGTPADAPSAEAADDKPAGNPAKGGES